MAAVLFLRLRLLYHVGTITVAADVAVAADKRTSANPAVQNFLRTRNDVTNVALAKTVLMPRTSQFRLRRSTFSGRMGTLDIALRQWSLEFAGSLTTVVVLLPLRARTDIKS